MSTPYNKAIAALAMGILSVLNRRYGWDLGLDEPTVNVLIAMLFAGVVFIVPNKTPAPAPAVKRKAAPRKPKAAPAPISPVGPGV